MLFKAINPALLPAIRSAIQTRYVGSSGGVVIDPNAKYVAATGGSDSPASGAIGSPYATISYAISQMSAGDTLYFRSGTHTTTANLAVGSLNGSTFERYPLDVSDVIIDGSDTYEGFRIANSTNNTFKNFIIQAMTGNGGVIFDDACSGGLAENILARNMSDSVGGNIGGFYLCTATTKVADSVTIRNCRAQNIFIGNGTTDSQSNASGIHSYGAQNCTIENFTAHDCGNGVFWKASTGVGNNSVSKSLFYDNVRGVRMTTDGGTNAHIDQIVRECIFYNITQNAIDCELQDTSANNTGMEFFNNTFDDIKIAIHLKKIINPSIYNNITVGAASPGYAIGHHPDCTLATNDINYNNYTGSNRWIYDRNDPGEVATTSFAIWQLTSSQDTNGNTTTASFTNQAGRDYTLASSLPGTGGVDMGAYRTGSETIGATV